jgi:hypothetical protein
MSPQLARIESSGSPARTVRVFGIAVECPGNMVRSLPGIEATAEIRFLESARAIEASTVGDPAFMYVEHADASQYLKWESVVEALVSADGSEIAYRPIDGASTDAIATYLLGQVLSFALIRRGIDPIHATVVVDGERAVGFVGQPGDGKSTLAAGFLSRGSRLLSDDMLVFEVDGSTIQAQPGTPRLKLFPGIAKSLLPELSSGGAMNPVTTKLVLHLNDELFVHRPVRLVAIYALREDRVDQAQVEIMSPRDAVTKLTENTFNLLVKGPDRMRRQLETVAVLASAIPVKTLSYSRDVGRIPEVVDAILEDAPA